MGITLPTRANQTTKQTIQKAVENSIKAVSQLKQDHNLQFMEDAANMLVNCFKSGNKVIIAGNGGSLCDASHFAEELTGMFRKFRQALPAIPLTDAGHITCTANDLGFEWVFARGVQAYGRKGDVFIGLTTSGNSPNIIKAIQASKEIGMQTITFLGKDGGQLKCHADLELLIESFTTSDRIQEAHMAALHIIIEIIEMKLFPEMFL